MVRGQTTLTVMLKMRVTEVNVGFLLTFLELPFIG